MKNTIIALVLIAVLGVGGFFLLGRNTQGGPSTNEFTLKVVNKQIVVGTTVMTVKQGDTVILNVTNDENEELHLHGYDKSVDLEAGAPASLSFVADKSGRFPFELEHSRTELGALEVQP